MKGGRREPNRVISNTDIRSLKCRITVKYPTVLDKALNVIGHSDIITQVDVKRTPMEWYFINAIKITDIFVALLWKWYQPIIPKFRRFWCVMVKILLYYVMTGFRYYNELIRLKSIEYLWWDYLIFPNRIKQWLVLVTQIKKQLKFAKGYQASYICKSWRKCVFATVNRV